MLYGLLLRVSGVNGDEFCKSCRISEYLMQYWPVWAFPIWMDHTTSHWFTRNYVTKYVWYAIQIATLVTLPIHIKILIPSSAEFVTTTQALFVGHLTWCSNFY